MDSTNTTRPGLEEKLAQFHEFFAIKHNMTINMKPLGAEFEVPSEQGLNEVMPYAFKIASQISEIESQALRPLRNLGEHANQLVEFLNHQSKKIDLMMSLILQQQDDEQYKLTASKFGGGGLVVITESPREIGEIAELKIFLTEEASAIFCYGEVIKSEECDLGYETSLIYVSIREEDQELLVRASLHLQALQLRARSAKKSTESQTTQNDE